MTAALELTRLRKTYAGVAVVDDLSLTVRAGSTYGLVGANGAGKSTAISMAVGLLDPDRGSAVICGHPVGSVAAKTALGVLPDGLALPERLTGTEALRYLGGLRGMADHEVSARAADLLRVLHLDAAGHTLIGDYSTGMRKKIGLALAMLHRPQLLVLDEPFEAVDPLSVRVVRALLADYARGGGTVLLSSHVLELVESCCDHVAIMAAGTLLTAGPIDDVRGPGSLSDAYAALAGDDETVSELSWLAG